MVQTHTSGLEKELRYEEKILLTLNPTWHAWNQLILTPGSHGSSVINLCTILSSLCSCRSAFPFRHTLHAAGQLRTRPQWYLLFLHSRRAYTIPYSASGHIQYRARHFSLWHDIGMHVGSLWNMGGTGASMVIQYPLSSTTAQPFLWLSALGQAHNPCFILGWPQELS